MYDILYLIFQIAWFLNWLLLPVIHGRQPYSQIINQAHIAALARKSPKVFEDHHHDPYIAAAPSPTLLNCHHLKIPLGGDKKSQ
jgi:hypothetical protein